jgi:uncharacterized protein (DUF2336 family)
MDSSAILDGESTGRMSGESLLALARDASAPSRRALVEAVTDLPISEDESTTRREREIMFDILRRLVHDAEMVVRRTISTRLARMSDAPRDLVRVLANDKIEIAYPILTTSGVLEDEDLVEIIKYRTFEHQLAVAIRSNLSEDVSDTLVETGNKNVIKCLLQNSTAKISRNTMEYLVDQAEREDIFREPLVRRKDLGRDLAERLFAWVSDTLRQIIVKDWKIDEATVANLLSKSTQKEWASDVPNGQQPTKAQQLADQMSEQGLLSQDAMLRVLKNGDVALFMAMLVRKTGLKEQFVQRIFYDSSGMALAVACHFAGFGRDGFQTVYSYARHARQNSTHNGAKLQKALKYLDGKTSEQIDAIVRRWQTHPNPTGMWDLGLN